MKITKFLLLAVMPIVAFTANAQESTETVMVKDNTPVKNNFSVALTLGYNNYANVQALPSYQTSYEAAALSTNWTDKKLMVGFEAGWFFTDTWKLNLGGGFNFSNNPGYGELLGTIPFGAELSPEDQAGEIPNYRAVADQYSMTYTVFTGVDKYFKTKVTNLMWYLGLRGAFSYSVNEAKYDEAFAMGKSMAEAFSYRGAVTMGVDYFVLPGMYIGAQIDPFAYTYGCVSYKPQEGLAALQADNHNFAAFAAPTVKVGFKFGKKAQKYVEETRPAPYQEPLPTCADCGKPVAAECAYGGSHPHCAECGKTIDACQFHGAHPAPPVTAAVAKIEALKRNVIFKINSAVIANDEAAKLDEIVAYLNKNTEANVTLTGMADAKTGSAAVNKAVSEKRVQAVAKYLKDRGINAERLRVSSVGDTQQVFAENDMNRVVICVAE